MKQRFIFIAFFALLATSVQAQIIGATNNSPQQKPAKTTKVESSLYKPTGHYLRFEAGYPQFASIAYGYQLNPYIMLGGGIGYGCMTYGEYDYDTLYNNYSLKRFYSGSGIPIFAEVIFGTPKYNFSFIADIKLGYATPLDKNKYYWYDVKFGRRFFGAINLGVTYRNFSICAGISSNNPKWYSFFVSYNLPLKILK